MILFYLLLFALHSLEAMVVAMAVLLLTIIVVNIVLTVLVLVLGIAKKVGGYIVKVPGVLAAIVQKLVAILAFVAYWSTWILFSFAGLDLDLAIEFAKKIGRYTVGAFSGLPRKVQKLDLSPASVGYWFLWFLFQLVGSDLDITIEINKKIGGCILGAFSGLARKVQKLDLSPASVGYWVTWFLFSIAGSDLDFTIEVAKKIAGYIAAVSARLARMVLKLALSLAYLAFAEYTLTVNLAVSARAFLIGLVNKVGSYVVDVVKEIGAYIVGVFVGIARKVQEFALSLAHAAFAGYIRTVDFAISVLALVVGLVKKLVGYIVAALGSLVRRVQNLALVLVSVGFWLTIGLPVSLLTFVFGTAKKIGDYIAGVFVGLARTIGELPLKMEQLVFSLRFRTLAILRVIVSKLLGRIDLALESLERKGGSSNPAQLGLDPAVSGNIKLVHYSGRHVPFFSPATSGIDNVLLRTFGYMYVLALASDTVLEAQVSSAAFTPSLALSTRAVAALAEFVVTGASGEAHAVGSPSHVSSALMGPNLAFSERIFFALVQVKYIVVLSRQQLLDLERDAVWLTPHRYASCRRICFIASLVSHGFLSHSSLRKLLGIHAPAIEEGLRRQVPAPEAENHKLVESYGTAPQTPAVSYSTSNEGTPHGMSFEAELAAHLLANPPPPRIIAPKPLRSVTDNAKYRYISNTSNRKLVSRARPKIFY